MPQLQQSLAEQMKIGAHEIERRKVLMGFTQQDFNTLKACQKWVESHIPSIVKQFYIQQTSISEIAIIIDNKETLNRLHQNMTQYVQDLFSGSYDKEYINRRLKIGKVHSKIGVSPKLYLSGVNQLQQIIEEHITEYAEEPEATIRSLKKLIYFDNQLIFDTYIASLQSEIESENVQLEEYAANLKKNISERTEKLIHLSMHDPLTQLYNRRAFYKELEQAIEISNRTNSHLTLLYIDFNSFKEVNDTYGHRSGDEVLTAFADSVRDVLRKPERAARYGGDEFCIITPNTKIEDAYHICNRLAERFSEQVNYDVTLSIGGASFYPHSEMTIEKLIQLADTQMYNAKRNAHKTRKHEFSFELRNTNHVSNILA